MFKILLRVFPVLTGIVLIAAAAAHRGMLNEPEYTSHWLIVVEVALAAVLLILLAAQALYAVVMMFAGKWGQMFLTIALLILTFILFYAGIAIDAPTLLYAT